MKVVSNALSQLVGHLVCKKFGKLPAIWFVGSLRGREGKAVVF